MITRIELELFKCFQRLLLPVAPLTLLSGTNASGKSTVMQALVLLHQTILEHEWSTRLQLNGSEIQLGAVADVVDQIYGRRAFRIALHDPTCNVRWRLESGEDKQAMSLAVTALEVDAVKIESPNKLRHLVPEDSAPPVLELASRLRRLTYLTAERVGPRDMYQLQDPSTIQVVGPRGENAVGLLHLKRQDQVHASRVLGSAPPTLLNQVEARMRQFFPGVSLKVEKVPQSNIVTLGLRTADDTEFHRPVNVGFGLTQVLPIIIGALSAVPGDFLLIENPEVHLHPAGQALMGSFLAEMAAGGIQVIVESHSDHVLNGIRRAVKNKTIAPDLILLHFFRPRGSEEEQVTTPALDATGNIDHWPQGFFDQLDKDLNYFADWGA